MTTSARIATLIASAAALVLGRVAWLNAPRKPAPGK
jgi:hypothetical protein